MGRKAPHWKWFLAYTSKKAVRNTPFSYAGSVQKIVSITWARNEADVLEVFVRYHSTVADKMIIVLHQCEDRSHTILTKLQREGLPIHIREDPSLIHRQSVVLTNLMHEVAGSSDAEWILPLDADEFLVGNVHKTIERLPTDRITLLPWQTYVPTPTDSRRERNILKRIVHRRSIEEPQFHKTLIPRSIAREPHTHLPEGNHRVLRMGWDGIVEPVCGEITNTLHLAHFPVRSEQQLRRKICLGWESHLMNPKREEGQAFQWKALYQRCCCNTPITEEELQDIALHYAIPEGAAPSSIRAIDDPVPLPSSLIELLYTEDRQNSQTCDRTHEQQRTAV